MVDFRKNVVGRLRLKTKMKIRSSQNIRVEGEPEGTDGKGCKILLRHAEVLEYGELGTRPLREAKAEDILILTHHNSPDKDKEITVNWTPSFTFDGFRYASITNWHGNLHSLREGLTAQVLHSGLHPTGSFS